MLSPWLPRSNGWEMGNTILGGSDDKESACTAGDLHSIPDWEDPLEKGKATHSSILA